MSTEMLLRIGCAHAECVALGELLGRMSLTQRAKLGALAHAR